MDLDNVSYVSLADKTLMFSEESTDIVAFVSGVVTPLPDLDPGTVGSFFYRDRFYLLLVFSSLEGGQFRLFRIDNYQEQETGYMILRSMIRSSIVPYDMTGEIRARAIEMIELVTTLVHENKKMEEGRMIFPDDAHQPGRDKEK